VLEKDCGVPDERWIDYHLGKLPPAASDALRRHTEGCSACRLACRQWAEWLGTEDESESEDRKIAPSMKIYRSLRGRMVVRSVMRKTKRHAGRLATVCACAALIVAAVCGLFRYSSGSVDTPYATALKPQAYAALHEPNGAKLMDRPGTRVYSLSVPAAWSKTSSAARPQPNVTVWINSDTEELFVLLDGMLGSDGRDVQAWGGSTNDSLTSLGVLEFHSSQAHLYSHLRETSLLDSLRFTIEPKGGSALPTSPDSALVRLAAE